MAPPTGIKQRKGRTLQHTQHKKKSSSRLQPHLANIDGPPVSDRSIVSAGNNNGLNPEVGGIVAEKIPSTPATHSVSTITELGHQMNSSMPSGLTKNAVWKAIRTQWSIN
jgi:hypothetical protein